ncbi:MAG: bifunctional D-glycero-beta-D-manno-heptose-7-phosphate kinase/D-glycero-beta-D-manno-heptose 1-phosphate adenylyltransferase HldE [Rhodospirillaceae bacterium]|nr:bifunctional D-glycero-beta-D-manno-heptose-7-phosphate kinase/D-glycero-beta-D-manno-heptose 1-phosphate adenylyltransferase HldE [Rhodospirillaceae bacterium]
MQLSIPDFSRIRVLVAGDAMLDEYWFGHAGRISPEAPVPVVETRRTERRPGGAGNVACNVAALGAQAHLAAAVGDDGRSRELEEKLSAAGVRCRLHRIGGARTITKLRVLARNQQLIRLDAEETYAGCAEAMASSVAQLAGEVDAIVLSDYAKGSLAEVEALISSAQDHGTAVLVDPKGQDFGRYAGATVLKPNEAEFAAVAGHWSDEDDFRSRGEAMVRDLELGALLVTRGERGMTLFPRHEQPLTLPAVAREVFDVTGAGDTVIALMAAGIGCGMDLETAASLANLGAGLVVRKIGVASVSPSELRLALHRRGAGGRGLVSAEELLPLVEESRHRGERVVMTNGCFDILHAGHVGYLQEAKGLGDRLVVAVNDDDSVARLKGRERPINPLIDRMAVLAGLAAVDWVVPFAEDTPAELIAHVLPDVLVKGGDYRTEEIAGGQAVLDNGGEVRILGLREGRSTSAIIEAIREGGGGGA